MSPGAALRFFLAIALGVWREVDASPRRINPVHVDAERVAEPQPPPGALRLERRAHLVQRPPAAQPAHGEEALEALLAERDKRSLLDQAHNLALERRERVVRV